MQTQTKKERYGQETDQEQITHRDRPQKHIEKNTTKTKNKNKNRTDHNKKTPIKNKHKPKTNAYCWTIT